MKCEDIEMRCINDIENKNFWELKQFQQCIKRMENSHKLCSDLSNMFHERSEIERIYSQSLNKWCQKWKSNIMSGPEYGSIEHSWIAFCDEAESRGGLHLQMHDTMEETVCNVVRLWQKDHFHRPTIPGQLFKEVKQIEHKFESAQKPWCKKFKHSCQTRKQYHAAVRSMRLVDKSINNTETSGALNEEPQLILRIQKLRDKLERAKEDVKKCRASYDESLEDLQNDSNRYMEEMHNVYAEVDNLEYQRIMFFKRIFRQVHFIIDMSQLHDLKSIYGKLLSELESVNVDKDLSWWSLNYGSSMPLHIPIFQEYSPESSLPLKNHTIVKDTSGVILKSVSRKSEKQNSHKKPSSNKMHISAPLTLDNSETVPQGSIAAEPTYAIIQKKSSASLSTNNSTNVVDNNNSPDWTDNFDSNDSALAEHLRNSTFFDDGKPGVNVKALYNYVASEEDELNFNSGDIFEKLEDEDEQGWCKGRKNGIVGLYPANYVSLV